MKWQLIMQLLLTLAGWNDVLSSEVVNYIRSKHLPCMTHFV